MKRHPSLHPLSEHHHHVLVRALEIRRAEGRPAAERSAALRQAGQTFVRFWKTTGHLHFRKEEEILLPAYARHARLEANPQITRMLAEHALIRAKVERLDKALRAASRWTPRFSLWANCCKDTCGWRKMKSSPTSRRCWANPN
jgi:hemerythrin-like domain-containing protein